MMVLEVAGVDRQCRTKALQRTGPSFWFPSFNVLAGGPGSLAKDCWEVEDVVSVSFAYQLVGSGWAECTIAVDEQHAAMTASYLSDALGDLLGVVIRMVEGQPEATASIAEELG
jgi:hypothetical protein